MTNWNGVGSGASLMKVLWRYFLKGTEKKLKKTRVRAVGVTAELRTWRPTNTIYKGVIIHSCSVGWLINNALEMA